MLYHPNRDYSPKSTTFERSSTVLTALEPIYTLIERTIKSHPNESHLTLRGKEWLDVVDRIEALTMASVTAKFDEAFVPASSVVVLNAEDAQVIQDYYQFPDTEYWTDPVRYILDQCVLDTLDLYDEDSWRLKSYEFVDNEGKAVSLEVSTWTLEGGYKDPFDDDDGSNRPDNH